MNIMLVCFDMDGVLFQSRNFWLELHKRLGTYYEGKELTEKYLKTDYAMLIEKVVGGLWKGKSAEQYYRLIEEIPYTTGAKETFEELKKKGIKTAILSSGPSDLAKRAQKDFGIDIISTNTLVIRDNVITGEFLSPLGFGEVEKVEVLKEITSKALLLPSQICFIGDDENDILVCERVGLSIAFNSVSEQLKKICKVTIDEPDLRLILDYL